MSERINSVQLFPRLADVYSDVTITFSDSENSISVKAHRNFLAWLVPYFDKLFTFSENLRKKEFNVEVEDAVVAELFIHALYGQKIDLTSNCYIFLHLCKLRSYFCLDIDLEQLYKLKIPAENFDHFLQVVNLPEVELGKRLIRKIRRNLPKNYKWEGINENFKREVMKKEIVIISGENLGAIKIRDLDVIQGEIQEDSAKTLTGHTSSITSIEVTEDQQLIVSGSFDQMIKIWNASTGECIKTLTGHTDWITMIVITKDQQHIISTSNDLSIKIWSIVTGECVKTLTGHTDAIMTMVMSEDQRQIISTSLDNTIKVWNVASGECVKTLTGHTDWIMSFAIAKEQQHLFSASADRTIKVWNVDSGECVKTLTGHTDRVRKIKITEDQKQIVSASNDCTIKIWDISTGDCIKTMTGHTNWVTSIFITEDQEQIISSGSDWEIKIWNVATGECVKNLTGHENTIVSLSLL